LQKPSDTEEARSSRPRQLALQPPPLALLLPLHPPPLPLALHTPPPRRWRISRRSTSASAATSVGADLAAAPLLMRHLILNFQCVFYILFVLVLEKNTYLRRDQNWGCESKASGLLLVGSQLYLLNTC